MPDESRPVWDRRLSGRARLGRAAALVATVLVALVILIAPTGLPGSIWRQLTGSQHPTSQTTPVPWSIPSQLPEGRTATLSMTGWQVIPVPEGGRSQIDFTPFPNDPAKIFACAAVRNIPGKGPLAGPIKLWRTYDSGQHWQILPSLPSLTADTCVVLVATGATERVLLLAHTTSATGSCLSLRLLLSENDGDSWTALSPPHPGIADTNPERCDAWVSSRSIFWYEAGVCRTSGQSVCYELLRSDDGGDTWLPADQDLTAGSGSFTPIWTNEDGGQTLYASYSYPGSHPAMVLWVTHNSGSDWQPVKPFPPNTRTNTFATQEPGIADAYPSNIIYRELIGPPETTLHNVAEGSGSNTWATLPPLPALGTDAHHDGIAQVLGVASAGDLLVLGPGPGSASSGQQSGTSPPDWLWVWNPVIGRWESAPVALPVIPEGATISWGPVTGSGGTTGTGFATGAWIWLVSPSADGTQLNRAFLP
jgi:hypothetical protein